MFVLSIVSTTPNSVPNSVVSLSLKRIFWTKYIAIEPQNKLANLKLYLRVKYAYEFQIYSVNILLSLAARTLRCSQLSVCYEMTGSLRVSV